VQISRQFPIISIASPRQQSSLIAVVRDEEAVGSNPATPTSFAAGIQPVYTFPLRFVVSVGLYARGGLG
jgi:hypothetical protein